jgi:hypothetical protein
MEMLDTSDVPLKLQTKTVIVTALISAVSTIAVAVLPGMLVKPDNANKRDVIHEESPGNPGHKAHADPGWRISGSVLDNATDKPVSAQLFLLKSDSIRPTDDGGKFVFDQVPTGTYLIQVEIGDSQGKRSSRYLIERLADREAVLRPQAGGPWIKVRMEPSTQE